MDIAGRVRLKSDRRARALILALCVAPVATPLLAAGLNSLFLTSHDPAQTAASEPARDLGPLTLRPAMDNPLYASAPIGPAARIESRAAPVVQTTSVAPFTPPPPQMITRPRLAGAQTFRDVKVADGLQLQADGVNITLAGVEPAPAGSECKRLDGVVEPCALRAANRLEILTRGRVVTCDLQDGADALRGACRAGKIDLADDLVRNGLAVRSSERL